MGERPLTDAEYDRPADTLNRFHGEGAMNLEQLDGFFAALICGPDRVHPSEYLPEIWGGSDMADGGFREPAAAQGLSRSGDAPLECHRRDLAIRRCASPAAARRRARHHPRERLGAGVPARHGAAASGLG